MLTTVPRTAILALAIALAMVPEVRAQALPQGLSHVVTVQVPLVMRVVVDSVRVGDGFLPVIRTRSNMPAANREIPSELVSIPIAILAGDDGHHGGAQAVSGGIRFTPAVLRFTVTTP